MEIPELFNGIAVIIDDEIEDTESSIYRIKSSIEERHIPVSAHKKLPKKETVKALANASFLIVDWDYSNGNLDLDDTEERVVLPKDYKENEIKCLIEYLKEINDTVFIPVFIFSSQKIDDIKEVLRKEALWYEDEKRNRIFIKSKSELTTEAELFDAIGEWLENMPPVYIFKLWEKSAQKAMNSMFGEMYKRSPEWVGIVWNLMKGDSIDYQQAFGSFITRSIVNRMERFSFNEDLVVSSEEVNSLDDAELQSVIEGERYLPYCDGAIPKQYYTGDLFVKGKEYYLNIRAQCDISRVEKGEYNPVLYLLKGEKLKKKDIITDTISITSDGFIKYGNGEKESLDNIKKLCSDSEQLELFNKCIKKHQNKTLLRYGSFIEHADKVIVGCIGGEKTIRFDLNLFIMKSSEIEAKSFKRIGRLLKPYITRVQQKCSQYIVREGVMPIPDELYERD